MSTISDSGVRVSPHECECDWEWECVCEVAMSIASSLVAPTPATAVFPSCIFSHSFFLLYSRHSTQSSNLSDPFLAAAARPASASLYSCMIQSVLTPRGALPA